MRPDSFPGAAYPVAKRDRLGAGLSFTHLYPLPGGHERHFPVCRLLRRRLFYPGRQVFVARMAGNAGGRVGGADPHSFGAGLYGLVLFAQFALFLHFVVHDTCGASHSGRRFLLFLSVQPALCGVAASDGGHCGCGRTLFQNLAAQVVDCRGLRVAVVRVLGIGRLCLYRCPRATPAHPHRSGLWPERGPDGRGLQCQPVEDSHWFGGILGQRFPRRYADQVALCARTGYRLYLLHHR